MAREQVVRITCDRCSKVFFEPTPDEPAVKAKLDPTVKGAADPRSFPFLAMGGRLVPELLAEVTTGEKMVPVNATLDEVCTDCAKRISDLVKQILYYRFKPAKNDAPGDNSEAPEDTGASQTEAPRAPKSKRNTPLQAED